MKGVWSGCKYKDETLDWMRTNFDIESGLTAEVYRSGLGDCTNGGISAHPYAFHVYQLIVIYLDRPILVAAPDRSQLKIFLALRIKSHSHNDKLIERTV